MGVGSDDLLGRLVTELDIEVKGLEKSLKDLDSLKEATKAAGGTASELAKLDKQSLRLTKQNISTRRELDRTTQALKEQGDAAEDAADGTADLTEGMSALEEVAVTFGVAAAVSRIPALAREAVAADAVFRALTISIDGAKDSTLGLVDSVKLGELANLSSSGVLKTNAADFAELQGAITGLALANNQDLIPTLDMVNQALAKGEVTELTRLGIIPDIQAAQLEYARSVGKTVEQLSDLEKQHARSAGAAKQLIARNKELAASNDGLGIRVGQLVTALDNAKAAMISTANEATKAKNTGTLWERGFESLIDDILLATPATHAYALEQQRLREEQTKGISVENALAVARGKLADQTSAANRQTAILMDLTAKLNKIAAEGRKKDLKDAVKKRKAQTTAAIEDALLRDSILARRPDLSHLAHLGGKGLQRAITAADEAAGPRRGGRGKRAKKTPETKDEFHLTDFEQLLQTTLGSGFKIGEVKGVRGVKLAKEDIKPTSIINVTNNDIDIAQTFEGTEGMTAEELQEGALKAARELYESKLAAAGRRSQVNQAI